MIDAHGEDIWKLGLGVLALLGFMGIGVGHILYPDYFIERTAMRRGANCYPSGTAQEYNSWGWSSLRFHVVFSTSF